MLGEFWALFMSDPYNEVDSITPFHSLTHIHNFAAHSPSINFFPPLPTILVCPDSALGCKRKESPPGSERGSTSARAF